MNWPIFIGFIGGFYWGRYAWPPIERWLDRKRTR